MSRISPRRIAVSVLLLGSVVFATSCEKDQSDWLGPWGSGKAEEGEQAPEGGSACATERSACVPIATGANLLLNGAFDNDLEGWVLEPTGANASLGDPAEPTVAAFDVRGEGLTTQSINLQVGQREYVAGTVNAEARYVPGRAEGAILSQEIAVDWDGLLEVTVDVAVHMPNHERWTTNKHAGRFDLVIDDQTLVSFDFGEIEGGTSLRRTLTARLEVAAGPHNIALAIRRPMNNDQSPTQYVDNFRAALAVVGPPELPHEETLDEKPEHAVEESRSTEAGEQVEEQTPDEQTSDEEPPPTEEPIEEPPIWVVIEAPQMLEALS